MGEYVRIKYLTKRGSQRRDRYDHFVATIFRQSESFRKRNNTRELKLSHHW
jgi:hypothetical protein